MQEMTSKVLIDDDRKHVLVRYMNTKHGIKVKESDNNSIVTEIKVKWDKSNTLKQVEMYNLKDPEGLKKFKEMTTNHKFLSEVFNDEDKNIFVKTVSKKAWICDEPMRQENKDETNKEK